jgi:hypothetical protein
MPALNVTSQDRERFARARARGRARAQDPSAVVEAQYDATRDAIDLGFRSGGSMTIPRQIVPDDASASPSTGSRPSSATPSAPLAGTSRLRRLAVYTRCPRCASLPRRPASGSVLSLLVPSRHAVLSDRGESIGCAHSVTTPMTLAFAESQAARHSRVPIIRFRWVNDFAASPVRYSLRPVELLAPLADLTGHSTQPTGTFTPELSTGRSPSPSSGITTVATEQVPPAGLSPAGTPASIAALTLSFTTPRRFSPAHKELPNVRDHSPRVG